MEDREFLQKLKDYIENTAVSLDGEYGCGKSLEELVMDDEMPDIYAEVLRRLVNLNL